MVNRTGFGAIQLKQYPLLSLFRLFKYPLRHDAIRAVTVLHEKQKKQEQGSPKLQQQVNYPNQNSSALF